MDPSSPILIWQPSGGVPPGTPGTTLPVYSQADVTPLIQGQAYIDVVFGIIQTDANWVLVECEVVNTTDGSPLNIWPGIMTSKLTTGFRLYLNGMPDSSNYYLHWAVSGVNIAPVPATSYLFTGPASAPFGVNEPFTVKLPPSTMLAVPITITPNDGGAGGAFSPPTVTLSSGSATATFVYNAVAYGPATMSVTNSGTLSDPAPIVFTSIAPTYSFSGPSSGNSGTPSDNFEVVVPMETVFPVPVTITPHDGGAGGTFTPSTVVLDTGISIAFFTYTPASVGAKTISVTNSGGLTNPGNLTYTATVAPHLLNTLISYWKLDEASGTRNDSQGTNHLTDPTSAASATGKIGNGVLLVKATGNYLTCADNSTLRVTSDFTFSLWVKLTSQGGGDDVVFGKDPVTGSRDYWLNYATGGGGFYCVVNAAAAYATMGADTPNGVWVHIVWWYDSSDQKVRMRVNDATTYVSTATSALVQTSAPFAVGHRSGGSLPGYLDGIVDELGFWKRILTTAEITALYNGGAGLPFSSFTA